MRTNVVLDPKLIARAMKKAGVATMRETIDIALRAYVSTPNYDALLELAGSGAIDPEYDPKALDSRAGFAAPTRAAEATSAHRSAKAKRPSTKRTRRRSE